MEKLITKLPSKVRRVVIGVFGGVVLLAGIVMIPYPGPGWAVVFVGLAVLAQEFPWAQRLLDKAKGRYGVWQDWLRRQAGWVKALFWVATAVLVIITIWLLNGYGLINDWLHLGQDWVRSPLFTGV